MTGCTPNPVPQPLSVTYVNPRLTVYPLQTAEGGNGSGVLIANGKMLTAAHVAITPNLFVVKNGKRLEAKVIKINEKDDVALMEVKGLTCPCASVAWGQEKVDSKVFAVGYPVYEQYKMQVRTTGNVQGYVDGFIKFSASLAPGNSGGGVFNSRGQLVGLTNAIAAFPLGFMGVAIVYHMAQGTSADTIRKFLKSAR